jgi:hypothetical protein
MEGSQVVVTERAVLQRVNRALAHESKSMRVCRYDSKWLNDLGRYYVVNTSTNGVSDPHADLAGWARELGALKDFENIST